MSFRSQFKLDGTSLIKWSRFLSSCTNLLPTQPELEGTMSTVCPFRPVQVMFKLCLSKLGRKECVVYIFIKIWSCLTWFVVPRFVCWCFPMPSPIPSNVCTIVINGTARFWERFFEFWKNHRFRFCQCFPNQRTVNYSSFNDLKELVVFIKEPAVL